MNMKLSVSGVFTSAWQVFTENVSYVYYLLIPSFALSLLGLFFSPETFSFQVGQPQVVMVRDLLFFILSVMSGIAAIFATISVLFLLRSNKKQVWADWKQYFRLLPKYVLVCILQGLMIAGGLILFIVPGIYLAIRYAFVSYRTLENPTEPIKSLFAAEAKATEGNRLAIFSIGLTFVGIVLVYGIISGAVLGSVVGAGERMVSDFLFELLITPFFTIVSILTYIKLTEKNAPEEAVTETPATPEKKEEVTKETPEKKEEVAKETPAPASEPVPVAEPVI